MQARRRRLAVPLTVAAALLTLTGCEKPTPLVTLYSGATSLNDEAVFYCFEGQSPAQQPGTEGACRAAPDGVPRKVLEVRPGDQVLVDVDRELADSGWRLALIGSEPQQESRSGVQREHVFRFSTDFSRGPLQTLEIQQLERPDDEAAVVGRWRFTLAGKF